MQRRIKLAGQLKDAVKERNNWDEVERLEEELEKLLKPREGASGKK